MEDTGWEDFKEISDEELSKRLAEPDDAMVTAGKEFLQEHPEILEQVIDQELKKEIENFKAKPIDRFGLCPCCKVSWDGGDIYEELLKKGVLSVNIGDAKKAAGMYGWTEFDKKHFSTLLTYELEQGIFVECPNCNHMFNQDTSKEYKSLYDLKEELKS